MVTENKPKKTLKLGNWQVFLLDKLHQFYTKGTLCDVTLRFDDNVSIQAHKVVLALCTTFFDQLPSSSSGVVLHMPSAMKARYVKPIINFMYSGKLEYLPEDQSHIFLAAKHLGMNVLTELLQFQVPPGTAEKKPQPKEKPVKSFVPKSPSSSNQGVMTVTESPAPLTEIVNVPEAVSPGKRLPFWKKRNSVQVPQEFFNPAKNKKPVVPPVVDLPMPTRFEWPDDETLPDISLSQSTVDDFDDLSYDSQVIIKPTYDPKPVVLPDSIEMMPTTTPVIQHGVKRTRDSEVVLLHRDDDDYEDTHCDPLCDTEQYVDDDLTVTSNVIKTKFTSPKPILKNHEFSTPSPNKKVRFSLTSETSKTKNNDGDLQQAASPLAVPISPITPTLSSTIVPVSLGTVPAAASVSMSSAPASVSTCYASASVGTSIASTPVSTSAAPATVGTSSAPASVGTSVAPTLVGASTTPASGGTGAAPINHAKIINEILKKYPELVKNNKNIKLKIQSGTGPNSMPKSVEVVGDGKGHTKVQYVLLKSDYTSVKKEIKKSEPMGAENRSGPWFCTVCGDDNAPLNFETYYTYRKHLQEVHNEKFDARICEHCGFKASKRNLHLYHLYTKHNIPPPRNINFPKCDQCNYIALSESLLIKHRSNHTGVLSKEFLCRLCSASFKSYSALMCHMQSNIHLSEQQNAKKDYECEFCGKIFNRNINLKAHIRLSHQDESRKSYDDEDKVDDPAEEPPSESNSQSLMEVIEVPVFGSVSETNNKALYLPPGMTILAESPSVPLLPSSESEAMNNVATGIATSINIADRNISSSDVIVIDSNSELILRAPTYVLNSDGSYSMQEYIVPDMINESGQVYTALVSTAPTTGISYVTTDNISLVTSASDHTYADGMKINGHVTTTPQTIITSQVSQESQPIIVQEPIIMSADWVQSIATSRPQKLDIITVAQTSHAENSRPVEKTAQNLVSDWGDLEEDTHDDSQDDSDVKPSRPTIEIESPIETDM